MASITIRNIQDSLKTRWRVRAAERGRSMEEEVRQILDEALDHASPRNLADMALQIFGPANGVELPPHPEVKASRAVDFGPA